MAVAVRPQESFPQEDSQDLQPWDRQTFRLLIRLKPKHLCFPWYQIPLLVPQSASQRQSLSAFSLFCMAAVPASKKGAREVCKFFSLTQM